MNNERISWGVSRGVSSSIEVFGIRGQYIFYFVGVLMFGFLFFVFMSFCSVSIFIQLLVGVPLVGTLIYVVFRLNAKYGINGITKLWASMSRPKIIKHRKFIKRFCAYKI